MKKIQPIHLGFDFDDDVERIVRICAEAGYEVTSSDARQIWEDYSESMAAGWMMLFKDDENVLNVVLEFSEVVKETTHGRK